MLIENRKVLITGASSGIGHSTALAFAKEGCGLFLVARRADRLGAVARSCREMGSSGTHLCASDLSVPGEGSKIVDLCLQQLEGLDVLICNAGYGFFGQVNDMEPEKMARMWQVNFQSAYESICRVLPHFRERKGGHIVLVSSIIGKKGMPYSASYCATKFAQVGLGEALWGELREEGIGVSVICPGYTATEFHSVAEERREALKSRRPFSGQSPEVVAKAVLNAVRRNRREIHLTLPGKLILLVDRFSNAVSTRIMAIAAKMDRKQRED